MGAVTMSDLARQHADYLRELNKLSTPPDSVLIPVADLLQICHEAQGNAGLAPDGGQLRQQAIIADQAAEIAKLDRELCRAQLCYRSAQRGRRTERLANEITTRALIATIADHAAARRWPWGQR